MPLLALDVEATIICHYDMGAEPDSDGRLPAIIDPLTAETLAEFKKLGFIVVLATGTDSDNLNYYEREFKKAGIHRYITSYSPEDHDANDSKADKIRKYHQQFQVSADEIYFFDDANNNVQAVKNAGYKHAHQVTHENPLGGQLLQLLSRLEKASGKQTDASPNELTEKQLITIFMEKHKKLSKFSLSSRVEQNATSLLPLIENALREDKKTTSLKTFVALKWMTENRVLVKTAPAVFREKFAEAQQHPMPHPKK